MTHYMVSYILAPMKHNIRRLSRIEVVTVKKIYKKVETNWAHVVITHMVDSKAKYMGL